MSGNVLKIFRKNNFIIMSLLVFLGLELGIFYPKKYLSIALIFLLLFVILFAFLIGESLKAWPLVISPFFLFLANYVFILFLDNKFLEHFFVVFTSFFLIPLYQVQVYQLLYDKEKYQRQALVHISSYINIISLFLLGSGLMGIRLFLNLPVWALFLLFVLIIAIFIVHLFWVNQLDTHKRNIYALVIGLILGELFWSLSFLSIHFLVSGVILTIFYYIFILFIKDYFNHKLDNIKIFRYLSIMGGSVILILITAQWF